MHSQDSLLSCPVCKQELPAPLGPISAGQKIKCAKCGAEFDPIQPTDGVQQPTQQSTVNFAGTREELTRAQTDKQHGATDIARAAASADDTSCLRPAQQSDELGRLGPYRVLQVLGRGGMGRVYLAEDTRLKRRIALKIMLPAHAAGKQARQRFLREAQAQAKLHHDHIVPIFDVGEDNDVPYLAMPLLEGETLADRLRRETKLSPQEARRITREVAAGLAAAHERGLIHRDIKPGNLWLEAGTGRVKILDFGLARQADASGSEAPITQAGAVVGTPAYMAPEQAAGSRVDARADLFSLGCVLYQMVTGEQPFVRANTIAILSALANYAPPPPAARNPTVPQALSDLVVRLLEKEPDDRPASARSLVESLSTTDTVTLAPAEAPASIPKKPVADESNGEARPWRLLLGRIAHAIVLALALYGLYRLQPWLQAKGMSLDSPMPGLQRYWLATLGAGLYIIVRIEWWVLRMITPRLAAWSRILVFLVALGTQFAITFFSFVEVADVLWREAGNGKVRIAGNEHVGKRDKKVELPKSDKEIDRPDPKPVQAKPIAAKPAKVEFSIQYDATAPAFKLKDAPVYLRPNTDHGVELFVKNLETDKEQDPLKDVVVRLMRVDGGADEQVMAAKLDKATLPPGERARVQFDPAKMRWTGKFAKIQLWLEAKGSQVVKQDIAFRLELPDRYVAVEKATYARTTGRISFIVSLKKTFIGPFCTVELVLDRDYMPGLKSLKNKTLEQRLTDLGQGRELFADLEFEETPRGLGDARVFLNVDGYERAFEFVPNFNDESGLIRAVDYSNDLAVRFRAKRYVLPDQKRPFTLALEIDGRPLDQPARVELALNRSEDNKEDEKFETTPAGGLRGLRDFKLILDAGKRGELLCKMVVADWKVPLNTAQMLGQRWLRVRVLDDKGKVVQTVSKDALKPLEAGRAGLAPLALEKNQVMAAIVIDDTVVDGVKFLGLPTEWSAGKDINVKVITKPRPANRYAPIEKAIFYFGKAGDKIPPEDQYAGAEMNGVWSAILPTPQKPGKHAVTVLFTTSTGVTTSESEYIVLKASK